MMDELGSTLRHSDEPNFMVAPFLYMPEGKLASAVRSDHIILFSGCVLRLSVGFLTGGRALLQCLFSLTSL